ncbi:hypothetical protein MKW94_002009 [Papaver nudicaule]|uniref:Uncharacterized protein n=1 Tax=Papaver nudicaule TaxID=74823 RepID=A0AA41SF33_PAPNU|nr:hypothetical protein [Papaver nudicaule]MCL7046380.1 hypothetical protein [Papaver nudicaule]
MAMKNALVFCFFLVISIFFAGGKAYEAPVEPCTRTWVSSCIGDYYMKACHDDCINIYGSQAKATCVDQSKLGIKNLCKCVFC